MTQLWMSTGTSMLRLWMAWIVLRHGGYRCKKEDRYYIKGFEVTLDKLPLHFGLKYRKNKVAGRIASSSAYGVIQNLQRKLKDWEEKEFPTSDN